MNLSLIILSLAVIAVFFIISFRFYEFHSGKFLLSKELRFRIEKQLTDFYKSLFNWMTNFFHQTQIFLKNLPTVITHTLHFLWRKFSKKVDDFFIRIRRKNKKIKEIASK
jgi:hypothetical protein